MRGQRHAPAALIPGKDPVPIVQEAGWAPGQVWTGAEKSRAPLGFDPRTVQARSQSLHCLYIKYPLFFWFVQVIEREFSGQSFEKS